MTSTSPTWRARLERAGERLEELRRWRVSASELGRGLAFLLGALQVADAVVRRMASGVLPLRAMSLVYTTLLSLAPLLAVSFSVLKAFGVHNQVEPALAGFLAPLGPRGAEIAAQMVEFVDNIRVGVLGALGLLLLLYTVVALIQKVEQAFNAIWQVRRARTLLRRFSDYLSVLLVGPLLVFIALGIIASLTSSSLVQTLTAFLPSELVTLAGRLAPFVLLVAAFTFVYLFVPNTRVRLGPALLGAALAALAWQITGWGFATFVAGSTRYAAIYSGFAILILFLIWLYLSWLILLTGSQIAFYVQNPHFIRAQDEAPAPMGAEAEALALALVYRVGLRHRDGAPPPLVDEIARELGVAGDRLEPILERLEAAEIVVHGGQPEGLMPARDIHRTRLDSVVGALRSYDAAALPGAVADLAGELDRSVEAALGERTVADLVGAEVSPEAGR
ncbi:membrane protein [Thiohalospira halophila DSM 15071]|uniref:Membrane protein n=1 Tax=Thiohalospira halophila DSM 15071 TaxID=1123397 RepID=A0A1I1NWG6_9GAMM|nr:YihY/virulence factor BrkB family protein [Thiohalospira halophila]SFD02031.1 membrane protein [Thiohalospira halophila DSM 15071]